MEGGFCRNLESLISQHQNRQKLIFSHEVKDKILDWGTIFIGTTETLRPDGQLDAAMMILDMVLKREQKSRRKTETCRMMHEHLLIKKHAV